MSEITRDLLSRLKRQGSVERDPQSPIAQHQPTVSSPLFSPSPSGPQPHHASAILSPVASAMNTPLADTANRPAPDLLSLLKFKQSGAATSSTQDAPHSSSYENLSLSATSPLQSRPAPPLDGAAGFARKPSSLLSMSSSFATPTASRPEMLRGEAATSSSAGNPQDYLLKLLNQAKPSGGAGAGAGASMFDFSAKNADVPVPSVETAATGALESSSQGKAVESSPFDLTSSQAPGKASPMRVFGDSNVPTSPFEPPTVGKSTLPVDQSPSVTPLPATAAAPASKKNIFTATNPFDFLSASSPRNQTPVPSRSAAEQSTPSKISFQAGDNLNSTFGVTSIGGAEAPTSTAHESVAEKVDEVGEQVSKQVEQALAAVTGQANGQASSSGSIAQPKTAKESISPPQPSKKAASDDVEENWEDEPLATPAEAVRVFNFPMRPFISINVGKFDEPVRAVDTGVVTEIARLKKEFDQIDRNLVSATQNHIVYPLKTGGFRVIQQDSGSHKQVFSGLQERVFNVSIGRAMKAADSDIETVVGTGVNGTILWTSLGGLAKDEQFGDEYESRGFSFPPTPANDENTSGGQLKTRVKPSSRNPEVFAYGRGKFIHIVYPGVARAAAYTNSSRVCDGEKYHKDHTSVIHTKKAGKDFSFSADDTVIATLDKAGMLKFWDIRKLIEAENWTTPSPRPQIDIKHPIMELATCNPEEKSWPTSVMFLDKEKPMTKGIALRYMIVGMKQNHTLQLWDLMLLKPVEEINFPHDSESDAICSIAYHPKSGMLAVGHPTRNSIYLLSISAPKYNLPPMSQARYLTMLAAQDKSLPAPESTIIVSGCREFSLDGKGQLRSLDILAEPLSTSADENMPLFELYVMHSKGITNLAVGRAMLGWSKEGKILNAVNAEKSGMITVDALAPLPAPVLGASVSEPTSTNGDVPAKTVKAPVEPVKSEKKPKVAQAVRSPSPSPAPKAVEEASAANGADKFEKVEKKKSKKKNGVAETSSVLAPTAAPAAPATSAVQAPAPLHEGIPTSKLLESEPSSWAKQLFPNSAPTSTEETQAAPAGIQALLTTEFDKLHKKIADDRRIQEASSAAKQDAILRLVSTSLTENIEPVMNRIVTDALGKIITGPIKDIVASSIDRNLQTILSHSVKQVIPREIQSSMTTGLGQVMQQPALLAGIADSVSANVSRIVDGQMTAALTKDIIPQFTNLAMNAALSATSGMEKQLNERLRLADMRAQQDAVKIDALVQSVSSLQEIVGVIAAQQVRFQGETAEMIKSIVSATAQAPSSATTPARRNRRSSSVQPKPIERTPEQIESDTIEEMLRNKEFEGATIQWLQSARQAALFDTLFLNQNPHMLSSMSPLVVLSVCAAVTFSLDTNVSERLAWLEVALGLVDPTNPEFLDVFPRIMEIITQRLQKTYMDLAQENMGNPVLRVISNVARKTGDLKGVYGQAFGM